jgi:hypothetical protein
LNRFEIGSFLKTASINGRNTKFRVALNGCKFIWQGIYILGRWFEENLLPYLAGRII